MATWKKVIVSGSNISQLNNDSGYLASAGGNIVSGAAQIATEISGSFTSLSSSVATDIATNLSSISTLEGKTLVSGAAQLGTEISGSFTSTSASIAEDIAGITTSFTLAADSGADDTFESGQTLTIAGAGPITTTVSDNQISIDVTDAHITGSSTALSSSLATRVTAQEVFSSSLDASFASEADLNTATSSLSASLATDIASNTNDKADKTAISGSFTSTSASIASDIADLPTLAEVNTITSSLSSSLATDIATRALEANVSGAFTSTSASIATDIADLPTLAEVNTITSSLSASLAVDIASNTNDKADKTAVSGSFTSTSASIAQDIAALEAATTVLDISGSTGNDQVTVGTDAIEFVGEGPITTVVTNNTVTFDVTDALITGSSTALSSSVESRLTTNESEIDDLQTFSSSFDTAFNLDGANVTIAGDLTVQGTQTAIDSNVLDIGDNIIALNGTAATFGGLAVNDATAPNTASGSLLWDATNDYWIAGPSQSEAKILLASGDDVVSGSGQLATDISGSFTSTSASIATDIADLPTLAEVNTITSSLSASLATDIASNTNDKADKTAVSGSFTSTSASIAQDIADITTSFTLSDGSTTDTFESGQTLTFTGAGPITATVSDNEVTFDVTDATISGSFTAASSSLAARITANEVFSASLDDDFVNNTELNTATQSLSSSLATDIATNVADITTLNTFSSSLESTIYSFTGSFSGDGSSLTNITVEQNATVSQSFTNAATASIVHNFGSDNIMVVAYENDEQFIPATIRAVDDNTVELHFSTNTTGRAIVARGGHIVSGSIPYANLIAVPDDIISGSDQLNQVSGVATTISGSFTATSASIAEDIAGISTSFDIAADSGTTNAVNSTETLTFAGAGPITTAVADNTVTFDVTDAVISGSFTSTSASIATDIADLPTLDEVNTITSSLSSSLATDIATRALEANVSGAFTDTSASIATDIANLSVDFAISGSTGNDIVTVGTDALTFAGTTNEIETTVTNNQVAIGIVTNPTLTGDVTITGDLTVTGDTFENQVTNLNIEDQFILLNSGSAAADAGIVINGQGAALGWDESENRFALDFEGATWNQTTITSDAYVAAVVTSDNANYQKVGNIRIDGDDIYIYS